MVLTDREPRRLATVNTETEQVLAGAIELSDDAIFTCEIDGTIATWSSTSERLLGHRSGAVVGRRLDVLFPVHLRFDVASVCDAARAGDRIVRHETEVVRADGMPIPIWLSECPLFDSDGMALGYVVLLRDITEQRLAQASLAEVESRLEQAETMAHVGSWLWDLRTGAVQWSAEFHRIHGVDPHDFDGTLDAHLSRIHPLHRAAVEAAIDEAMASGRPFEEEYKIVRPDDDERVLRVRAQPTFGSAGTPVGLRGIGQDVTDQAGDSGQPVRSVVTHEVPDLGHEVSVGSSRDPLAIEDRGDFA